MNNKEICWNITARCNQNCKYCHRFLKIKELTFEENKKILNKLIDAKITDITWTGGEALLLDHLDELIKTSSEHGIKNKLITNGKLLTKERIDKIGKYLDSITLSLDSTDNEINEIIGRGYQHFDTVKNILDYLSYSFPDIKVRINSVVCSYTKNISDLAKFLDNYNIYSWRIFKFMPLRELAVINKDKFKISIDEYEKILNIAKKCSKIKNIDSRVEDDMEKKYILILADGSIIVTENGNDIKVGNAISDNLKSVL